MNMIKKIFNFFSRISLGILLAITLAILPIQSSSVLAGFSLNRGDVLDNSGNANEKVDLNTSLNWAGYTATSEYFTGVKGSWVVPDVKNTSGSSLSGDATWIGIGGVNTTDLIQIGIIAIVENSQQVDYQAFYEMLPNVAHTIPLAINQGDSISASISEQGDNQWLLSITNNSTGRMFSKTVTYQSSHSSVDWIEERPLESNSMRMIPLNEFDSVDFTGASATKNEQQIKLKDLNPTPITMRSRNNFLTNTSSVGADGASFSVIRANNQAAFSDQRITANRLQTAGKTYVVTFPSSQSKLIRIELSW